MRRIQTINENWKFTRDNIKIENYHNEEFEIIDLPHTWNAIDGQDGGNDYYRGRCWYLKELEIPELELGEQLYLEVCGANSSADVYINGKHLASHDGGYSTFRVRLTDALEEKNLLAIAVDNSPNDTVYPQKADFTFYGGVYRDVRLIVVPESHFDLDYYGSPGIKITPKICGNDAQIKLEAWLTNSKDGESVRFNIKGVGEAIAIVDNNYATAELIIKDVRLWDGLDDPYLYTCIAYYRNDKVSLKFGCRSFEVDKEKGFLLNGRPYPLRGVSRHQDRKDVGNAITKEMMEEDLEIIQEMGANTIRLAHYQHDQYFYDLCDRAGIVVWAEIPYITCHMPGGVENTISQMTELVVQNHHHPSIVCWGLSNEITAHNGVSEDLVENHKLLNELCHKLDSTRFTTMAHVFMLDIDEELVTLPDVASYNLYYGWYLGELEDNDKFFDNFRKKYPNQAIGFSEYGADATLKFQTESPERGDYTEQYQALYHEHMLEMIAQRPYIWASYAWNMFDFGADGRNEGGEHGINHKGLVSFDRKVKKDAFYIYKAYLSDEPFVHICGRRYIERHDNITTVKVYSNQKEVSLYKDGILLETQKNDKVFSFRVPISTKHVLEVRSGDLIDQIHIEKVEQPNKEYVLEDTQIINWFEKEEIKSPEGYFSIKDTIGDIRKTSIGAELIKEFMAKISATRGEVAVGVKRNEALEKMINSMTVEQMLKQGGKAISEETVFELSQALNKIPKPKM